MANDILISGGGIGGLTAAIALHALGHRVRVIERAPAMGWGQGVQISPPGMATLATLGLDEAVRAAGQVMQRSRKLTRDGLVLREREFGRVSGVEQPHVAISRGTLQTVLGDAVRGLDIPILLDHAVQSFDEGVEGIDVSVAAGESVETLSGDLLIGADGIHSAVRAQLFPEDRPVYTGYVQYRGVIPRDAVDVDIAPGEVTVHGDAANFYSYYLMNPAEISFGACVHVGPAAEPTESWASKGEPDQLLAEFEGFSGPLDRLAPGIPYLARMHIFDHETLPYWGRERVTLLGDAAHAMLPFAGQATVTAIEDAATLSRCLGEGAGDIAAALSAYQDVRIPHVGRIRDHCRDRGGIFEEYQVAERLAEPGWASLDADQRQARLDGIDWSRHDSFLRTMY